MLKRTTFVVGAGMLLAALVVSCTLGGGRLAGVTATPTKTPRPLFTATSTPSATPVPTDTPTPTETPVPPTETAVPTETPVPPTETPVPPTEAPTETPTDTPAPPTDTAVPSPTAPRNSPTRTASPATATATAKPQVDFRVKEIAAFEDGSLTVSGLHNIYFTVIDAGGAPIDGIILKDANNPPGDEVTTGNKGPGKTEFTMWAADYRFKVVGNAGGQSFSSETTHVLSVLYEHAVWDDLIRGGICGDEAACRALGPIHFSYNVTFQRTW